MPSNGKNVNRTRPKQVQGNRKVIHAGGSHSSRKHVLPIPLPQLPQPAPVVSWALPYDHLLKKKKPNYLRKALYNVVALALHEFMRYLAVFMQTPESSGEEGETSELINHLVICFATESILCEFSILSCLK